MDDGLVLNHMKFQDMRYWSLNPCCSGRWSSTAKDTSNGSCSSQVLILVVVDDGLVLSEVVMPDGNHILVLILVVVDDGLVLNFSNFKSNSQSVLILVVVDDGLVQF